MKRVIITGPTGSIGIALIRILIKKGIEVLTVCRPNSNRISRIPKHPLVKVVECDLSQLKGLESPSKEEYDVFYHFGWDGTFGNMRNDMYIQAKNIECSLDAVAVAERLGCKTFIGAGSQAEYGRVKGLLTSYTNTNPENGYGIAKLCAGQMTRLICKEKGIKHVWTRILSIYGPNDGYKTMVMSTIGALLKGNIPMFTKGEQQWDYLYCDDAANALYLASKKGKDGQVYCIGSGSAKPLYQYIYSIRDAIDPNLKLGIGEIPYSDKQVMYLCADISNLTEDVGFIPKVSFEEGIRKTINWYIEDKKKNSVLETGK